MQLLSPGPLFNFDPKGTDRGTLLCGGQYVFVVYPVHVGMNKRLLAFFQFLFARSMSGKVDNPFYTLVPLKLGYEVHGVQLSEDVKPEVIEQIKKDVSEHRLMVFRQVVQFQKQFSPGREPS